MFCVATAAGDRPGAGRRDPERGWCCVPDGDGRGHPGPALRRKGPPETPQHEHSCRIPHASGRQVAPTGQQHTAGLHTAESFTVP